VGAVIDLLSKVPLPDVPPSLLIAWAIWVIGGLLLMLWFRRRSASTRFPEFTPVSSPPIVPRSSGTHAVAGSRSGVHAAARKSAVRRATAPAMQETYGTPTGPPPHLAPSVAPSSRGSAVMKAQPSAPLPDAYAELSRLLDSTDDPSQSNS
jgi:hypothetical protein